MRLIVGIMLFMASFTSYLLRVNMSINILGMAMPITTNDTSVIEVPDVGYVLLGLHIRSNFCLTIFFCSPIVRSSIQLVSGGSESSIGSIPLGFSHQSIARRITYRTIWRSSHHWIWSNIKRRYDLIDSVVSETIIMGRISDESSDWTV